MSVCSPVSSGIVCDLQAPDFETRLAILEHMMYSDGINLSRDVVEYVAHNINTNIRELQVLWYRCWHRLHSIAKK